MLDRYLKRTTWVTRDMLGWYINPTRKMRGRCHLVDNEHDDVKLYIHSRYGGWRGRKKDNQKGQIVAET